MTATDPYTHLQQDEILQPVVTEHGELVLEPADDPFQRLVTSIVNQQLSVASAAAIRERLFNQFTVMPTALLEADDAALADVGLSSQKITYIRNVADHFLDGNLDQQAFVEMTNDAVVDELTQIHGIGDWTAKMFLMFCLGREDVLPLEDLGIRNGISDLYGVETRTEMRDVAAAWQPYRSIASLYIWRYYEA